MADNIDYEKLAAAIMRTDAMVQIKKSLADLELYAKYNVLPFVVRSPLPNINSGLAKEMMANEEMVYEAVQHDGNALRLASDDLKNNVKIVSSAVQQTGSSIQWASDDLKNNETIVHAAIQQDVSAIQWASQEVQKKEDVVTAACRLCQGNDQSWDAVCKALALLELEVMNKKEVAVAVAGMTARMDFWRNTSWKANWGKMPPELRNKEEVAMAATAKQYHVWEDLSPDMQENEKVLFGIMRHHPWSYYKDMLEKSPKGQEIMTKVTDLAREFDCWECEAAHAMVEPVVVQLSAIDNNSPCAEGQAKAVTCRNMAGDIVATVTVKPGGTAHDLQHAIAEVLNEPPVVLHLVLPSGQRLRDVGGQKPLCELFP